MKYKAKWADDETQVIGIRNIKNNFLRRSMMIICYFPLLLILAAWNICRAILWIFRALFLSFMALTESFYINWNYRGDDEE